jgi:hypothetical protein
VRKAFEACEREARGRGKPEEAAQQYTKPVFRKAQLAKMRALAGKTIANGCTPGEQAAAANSAR